MIQPISPRKNQSTSHSFLPSSGLSQSFPPSFVRSPSIPSGSQDNKVSKCRPLRFIARHSIDPTFYLSFESERGQPVSLARRFVRQSTAEEHGTRANAFLPTAARPPEQSILPVRHRARPRWRASSGVVLVRYVHDHVVEIRQELWIEQRKYPLVQLSRVSGGNHVMIPRARRLVLPPVEVVEGALAVPAAKIVEAVRAAAAVILKPVHRLR